MLFDVAPGVRGSVWAVGLTSDVASDFGPFAARWDGSRWKQQPIAIPDNPYADLIGVDTSPDGEVWAVGGAHGPGTVSHGTLAERRCP